jgi:hypothetical protein
MLAAKAAVPMPRTSPWSRPVGTDAVNGVAWMSDTLHHR